MTVVTPFLTFPAISWWARVIKSGTLIFDTAEHFEKMTFRNKYRISGANNSILLSIPLVDGRSQRKPMKDICIHNEERWQVQHWRTLVSVYSRTPYFEHYREALKPLFEKTYIHLIDFNMAGIEWVSAQLKMRSEIKQTDVYLETYPPGITDIRAVVANEKNDTFPKYYQVFEDRIGFQPDLSILDLLFSEGPGATGWLNSNVDGIIG